MLRKLYDQTLALAGHRHAAALVGEEALVDFVRANAGPGDIVVCLGAGTITAWANALPKQLAS